MGNSNKTNISTELRFMWYHFNKIKSFIQNGMPNELQGLLSGNRKSIDGKDIVPIDYNNKQTIENKNGQWYICWKDELSSVAIENKDNKELHSYNGSLYIKKENGLFWRKVAYGPCSTKIVEYQVKEKDGSKHSYWCFEGKSIGSDIEQSINKYQWSSNGITNNDITNNGIFTAITDFFHFCHWKAPQENSALFPVILGESLEISTLLRFTTDDKIPSIISASEIMFHHFYELITNSLTGNTFQDCINSFCIDYKIDPNFKNNLHFLRLLRNIVSHNCIRKQRFDEVIYCLYVFICLFYIAREKRLLKDNFLDYINNHKEDYYLAVTIDGEPYKHAPFTKINSGGKEIELTLDYQNAEIKNGIPVTKEYISLISGVGGVDNGKIIEALRKALNDKNNNDGSIYETLAQIKEQSAEILKSINGDNKGIKQQLEGLQKEIIGKLATENSKSLLESFNESLATITSQIDTKTEEIKTHTTEVISEQTTVLIEYDKEKERKRKEDEKRRKKRLLTCLLWAIIGIAILFFSINWVVNKYAEPLYYQTGYEFFLKRAHPDLIYERALSLEKEDKTEDACNWYSIAKERYAEIVAENPNESKAAYRLAQMFIRLKGGSDDLISDYREALPYAKIAAKDYGYGLYAYIHLLLGNEDEACQAMLEIEDGNSVSDDYSRLTGLCMELFDWGTRNQKSLHISDEVNLLKELQEMCMEANEAREEALVEWYNLLISGIMGCDFYAAECLFLKNRNNIPLLLTYLTNASLYANYSFLETALEKCWQSKIRFSYPMMHDLIKRGLVAKPPYMKELSACVIQADGLNPFEYIRKVNLNIRHKHVSEDTFDYIQHADSVATLNPFMYMDKNSFLNVFLLTHDAIEIADLEKLNFACEKTPALCGYLMGIKYAKGYGVEKDLNRADTYFMSAAEGGLKEARYTWAVRLYQQGKTVQAVRLLKPLAEDMDDAKIWMSYMLRDLDPQSAEEYLEKVEGFYQPYRLVYALDKQTDVNHEILKEMHFALRNSLGESKDFPEKIALLAVELSRISFMLGQWDEAVFYAYWATNAKAEIGYVIFPYLNDGFHSIGQEDQAERLFKDMCSVYFKKDGSTLDDNNKLVIIYGLMNRYPHLINQLTEELGYNPAALIDPDLKPEDFIVPDFTKALLPDEYVLDLLKE